MTLSMYDVCVPHSLVMLDNISALIDKAVAHCAAKKIDQSVIVNYRLAADMLPFSRQIQIMSDQAKGMGARLTGAEVPTKWADLIDPRFRGRVGIAHPAFSGYFGQWVLALKRLYGWQYFEKLAANRPRIGRSGNDPITSINAGECVIGTGPMGTTVRALSSAAIWSSCALLSGLMSVLPVSKNRPVSVTRPSAASPASSASSSTE